MLQAPPPNLGAPSTAPQLPQAPPPVHLGGITTAGMPVSNQLMPPPLTNILRSLMARRK